MSSELTVNNLIANSDLPEELKKELVGSRAKKIDNIIEELLNENGSELSLDQILIGIYHKIGCLQAKNAQSKTVFDEKAGENSLHKEKKGRLHTAQSVDRGKCLI